MRLSCTLLCATALVSASAALAADLPTYKAPPAPTLAVTPPPYSWTGFYIGVGGGASALQVDSKSRSWLWGYNSSVTGDYHAHGGESSDLGKFGAFGTIEAGADYQMDRFVVGAFTNFDLQSLSAKSSSVAQASCSIASDNTCSVNASHHVWYKVGDSWDAGLRLGYLITDRNLLYALGGYSGAQISSGARIDGYATVDGTSYSTFAASSESQWKSGFVVGAGWETALTDHITLKAEYRYADYGDVKSYDKFEQFPCLNTGISGCGGGARQSGDVAVQTVRVVLGYKF